MTGERLREELERIAEGAPRVHVPGDLYARGRRATARARILAAGAAVAVVALLFAVVVPALQPERTPVADRRAPGVPDRIYAVPAHVDEGQSDLAIGRGAAAFTTQRGVVAVVDAGTGDYRLLDLAGLSDRDGGPMSLDDLPIALAPNGRYLAWGWLAPRAAPADDPRSGVRIADLTTGSVRDIALDLDHRMLVDQVSWSADSSWLAWGGTRITEWTVDSSTTSGYFGGTVGPHDTTSAAVRLPVPKDDAAGAVGGNLSFLVAVSNDGEMTALSGDLWQRASSTTRIPVDSGRQVSSLWFDDNRVFTLAHAADSDKAAVVRELPDGEDQVVDMLGPEPRMLGVLRDGTLLAHQEELDGGLATGVDTVALDPPTDGVDVRRVIDVDAGVSDLTLATDLMDADDPTVARPEPDWPWSTERKVMVGGLGVLALVALGGAALSARRRLNSR